MPNQVPATEKLRIRQVVAEETVQTVVRDKIIIPVFKPAAEKILTVEKSVKVKRTSLLVDKAIIDGELTVQVVYVACEPDQSVHHVHGVIPFSAVADLPGVEPDMDLAADVQVEDIMVNITGSCPPGARELNVTAVLATRVKVTRIEEINVVTSCPAGLVCESERIKIDHVIVKGTRQVVVSETVVIPSPKPAAEKIISSKATAELTSLRAVKDKVIVEGIIKLSVLYVARVPEQTVHEVHAEIKFGDYVQVPGATADKKVQADVMVENVEVNIVGERLRADIVLQITASVIETKDINVITAVSGAQVTTIKLRFDRIIGEASTRVIIRETFRPPEVKPPVAKIVTVSARDVRIDEARLLKNRVVVNGTFSLQLVYVAAIPTQPVHAMQRDFPFHATLEILGAEPGMRIDVKAEAEYVRAEADTNTITVEALIKVMATVSDTVEKEVVTAIMGELPPVCPPGTVFEYAIQAGDTFYKLAKRFGTTVEAIQALNPGIDPQNLQIGMVIKIPCGPAKG